MMIDDSTKHLESRGYCFHKTSANENESGFWKAILNKFAFATPPSLIGSLHCLQDWVFFTMMKLLSSLFEYLKHDFYCSIFALNEPALSTTNRRSTIKIDELINNNKGEESKSSNGTSSSPSNSQQQQIMDEKYYMLDIKETFAPSSEDSSNYKNKKYLAILYRFISVLISLIAFVEGVSSTRWVSMGYYFTNWALVFTFFFYQLPVLMFSLKPELTTSTDKTNSNTVQAGTIESTIEESNNNNNKVEVTNATVPTPTSHTHTTRSQTQTRSEIAKSSFLARIAWASYSIASVAQIHVTTVYYWALIFSSNQNQKMNYNLAVDFYDAASHGIVCLLLLIDGIFVSVVPVRFTHLVFVYIAYTFCYLSWMIIHTLLDLEQEQQEGGNEETSPSSDAYVQEENENETIATSSNGFANYTTILGTVLVFLPTVFSLIYLSSLFSFNKNFSMDGSRRKKYQVISSSVVVNV